LGGGKNPHIILKRDVFPNQEEAYRHGGKKANKESPPGFRGSTIFGKPLKEESGLLGEPKKGEFFRKNGEGNVLNEGKEE